jgi:Na+/proline symporter
MLRLICLLLLSGSLYGQTLPDSARIRELSTVFRASPNTAADTVQALHRLFANQRTGGGLLAGLGGAALLVTPFITVAADDPTTKKHGSLGALVGGVMLGLAIAVPLVTIGIVQTSNNSKEEEAQIISQYMTTHTLPKKIKRKLLPALFLPINSPTSR